MNHEHHSPEHCGDLESFLRFLEWLLKHQKEINLMATVQLSVSFTVNGGTPPNPLVVTPATAALTLTVGTAADGTAVAVVSGGTAPYTYALDPSSGALPPGVNFSEDSAGNITLVGTPTTAGTSSTPVLLNITDADGVTAQLRGRIIT